MRILYILPNGTVKSGGNWVTASRLAEGFKKREIGVEIIEVKDIEKKQLIEYDVIHAFHVFKSLIKINHLIIGTGKTAVVSFTGTDLKQLQEMGEDKYKVIDLLNKTAAIIVFHNEAREQLIKEGILQDKVKVIPQTSIPMTIGYKRKEQDVESLSHSNCVTFLFAGGIRKVKAPLEVIEMMSNLLEKVENIRLVIIGPILENDLGEKFKEQIEGKDWIKYLGEVSHQDVQDFISESDIIINCSVSEGMSNTLLEAQQMGKPILATDIAGNRAIVTHGVDGFLFNGKNEFDYYATKLAQEPKLRLKMGSAALKAIGKCDLAQEIKIYEKTYQESIL